MTTSSPHRTTYRLARSAAVPNRPPRLDEQQQAVVDHPGGPLLVLAGPGTGKTTTLVEAIVDRIERRGAAPETVLALTFSRKAAEQLRDRVTARLGRTTTSALAATFHSFAYGLIRAYAPADLYAAPLRLLSAPEQDVVLQELLHTHPEAVRWPDGLTRALASRGFAREVQAVLGRAREKGLDGATLRKLGELHDLPEYVAAGLFLDQYLDVLDHLGATDYADLVRRATLEAEVHREELRARFGHVFVDEYQDTDPGQVALLAALAGDGRNLTVVGDPHQSIYGFRGAEVRGILEFPTAFPHPDGRPADVVALGTTRRFGPGLLRASQRVAGRLSLQGTIDPGARAAFLNPTAADGSPGAGKVEAKTFDTERAESEHIADLLRRAHLEDGIGWSEMAVLVRSGQASIPALRRSLGAAGVPVEVAGDDTPLVRDPAVRPLLDALRAVLNLDNDDPEHVDHVDAARAEGLLLGPLGGLDAGELRRLSRALRARERAAAEPGRSPRSSGELVRQLLLDESLLDGLSLPEAGRAAALAGLLRRTRAQLDAGATTEELLWTLWDGTGWPERLLRAVDAGGAAARRAHRDLDAISALFDAAARAEGQRDHVGVRNVLATLVAQRIPGETLAERGVRGEGVRLLTAHRAKGLQWRLVVVAHVQEESWPDLRHRATLLRADRIGAHGLVPPASTRELLQEERRLFYVACTRARERLVVTAVAAVEDDGEQPSRFVAELGVTVESVQGRPRRPLSLPGLVAELRRTLADPATSTPLRDAAARRLAGLAAERAAGRQLVPEADPANWWGTRGPSRADRPLREPDQPVPVSATLLDRIMVCPAQWFLEREAGGVAPTHQSANLGQIVHTLAERTAEGEIDAGPDDVDLLMREVDAVWDRLEFRTPWSRDREHARTRQALARFLAWHHANPRRLVGTEEPLRTELELPDGERVELRGYADRLELDQDGEVVVVDLKTGRKPPSDTSVRGNRQLGLYQLAIDHGAVQGLVPGGRAGGAELVQLGMPEEGPAKVQAQPVHAGQAPEREQLREELGRAAAMLRAESFPAVAGQHCRGCAFVPICPVKSAGGVMGP